MDDDDRLAMISKLESRMDSVEGEIKLIREDQNKLREDIHDAALENVDMSGKIRNIESILIDMSKKRMRTIDIVILIVGLAIGATSAYAAVQNNQLTKVMVKISQDVEARK